MVNERDLLNQFRKHGMSLKELNLYKNFVLCLACQIDETYIDDEVMTYEIQLAHFKYCWDIVVNDHKKIGILFCLNNTSYNYFEQMFYKLYYTSTLTASLKKSMVIEVIYGLFEIQDNIDATTQIKLFKRITNLFKNE